MRNKLFDNFDTPSEFYNFDDEFKQSLDNSYDIITGRRTYVEIICDSEKPHFFFFEPTETPAKEDIEDLIYIYEDYEEYEKCGELMSLIK